MATVAESPSGAPPSAPDDKTLDVSRDGLVIVASSLGTVFEWYDFFIYGTLATVLAHEFFPWAGATGGFLYTLAAFGAGFGVRPLGAVLFGVLGDKLGRKYTFLVTITLMGLATAAVGVLPTFESIGIAAPPYSPPSAKPWAMRNAIRMTGAKKPIVS